MSTLPKWRRYGPHCSRRCRGINKRNQISTPKSCSNYQRSWSSCWRLVSRSARSARSTCNITRSSREWPRLWRIWRMEKCPILKIIRSSNWMRIMRPRGRLVSRWRRSSRTWRKLSNPNNWWCSWHNSSRILGSSSRRSTKIQARRYKLDGLHLKHAYL